MESMRTIIAGSRSIRHIEVVRAAVLTSGWAHDISVVVSGTAGGVDTLGEQWAHENDIPVARYPANWKDTKAPGARIKYDRDNRPYNANAGHDRNRLMAQNAAAALLIWDGESPGTRSMRNIAQEAGLLVFVYYFPFRLLINAPVQRKGI
jgi:predicted Rossmann fold nucleotide-binding protein DprA/Smf involved in DNA uptake